MANVQDCDIIENEFKPQSCNYVHLRTNTLRNGMNRFIPPAVGWTPKQLCFYKDGFGIKQPMKLDIFLDKEKKHVTKYKIKY